MLSYVSVDVLGVIESSISNDSDYESHGGPCILVMARGQQVATTLLVAIFVTLNFTPREGWPIRREYEALLSLRYSDLGRMCRCQRRSEGISQGARAPQVPPQDPSHVGDRANLHPIFRILLNDAHPQLSLLISLLQIHCLIHCLNHCLLHQYVQI